MPALRDTHRYALSGDSGVGNPDVTEHHCVPGISRIFQEGRFVADRIGEDRLEYEALPLSEQFKADSIRHGCCLIRINVHFRSDIVSIDEPEAARPQVRIVKRRFAGTVRPRERDNNWPRIQDRMHLLLSPAAKRLELAVHESAGCAGAVFVDANKVTAFLFVVRERSSAQVF